MKRFLIIQTAYIGDVILATPLIENLASNFPDSKIDFLVKKGNEQLLQNHPILSKVFVLDKSQKIKSIYNLICQFRKEKYHAIFNLHRFTSSGLITLLSRSDKRYGFNKNPFSFAYTFAYDHKIGNGTHEVDRNLKVISAICSTVSTKPKLFPSNSDFDFVSEYKEGFYFCIAPSSVWFTKQVPKQKWVELIQSVSKNSMSIYLLGAQSDQILCEEILIDSGVKRIQNLSGKLSLMQSAALMRDAKMNFVNDSGPLHIASAMNAPVSVFFCSTIPEFGFGPLSDESEIIEVKNLECRPCGIHGHKACPKGHFKCGNLLELSKFNS